MPEVWTIEGYAVDKKGNRSNTVTKTITVNANPLSDLTVIFDTKGGTDIQSASVASGSTLTKPDDPEKSGHSFDGWHKDEQYSAAWDFDNDVVTGDITLYAKWIQNKIIYPHEVSNISHLQVGYAVIIFWKNPDDENFSHVRIIPAEFEWAESDLFDKEPGISSYSMLDYLGVEYITIKSIDKNGNISNGVKYYFDPNNNPDALTVAFECNGGTGIQPIIGLLDGNKINKPNNPSNPGYSFGGWYKDIELTEAWDFENDVVADDITLYAKWTPIIHTVAFEAQGGTPAPEQQSVANGERAAAPSPVPVREGYALDGWYKEDTYATEWNFTVDVVTAAITLHAKWTQNKYTVTFYRNWNADDAALKSIEGNAGEQILFPEPDEFERDGYTLLGWNTTSEGTGTAYFVYDAGPFFGYKQGGKFNFTDEPIVLGQENIELYAIWTDFYLDMDISGFGGGGFEIRGYYGSNTSIVIPEKINTWPVTCIGAWSFSNKNLTSVVIPNSILLISDGAFRENKLSSITIPNSVKHISGGAFWENDLREIVIGNNVGLVPTLHDGPDAFEEFVEFYNAMGKKAGKYYINSGTWVWKSIH
jgi:uncharacterized repeat protein (TIGR02543 family)